MEKNKKSRRKIIILAVCTFLIMGGCWKWLNTWGFRSKLPWSASEIYEWSREDGFLPDYSYFLKAKITQEEYLKYIEELNLKKHTETSKYPDGTLGLNWSAMSGVDRNIWNPSISLSETYVWQNGHEWVLAKHENGYLYLKALNH